MAGSTTRFSSVIDPIRIGSNSFIFGSDSGR
jgi:hypothetical protein